MDPIEAIRFSTEDRLTVEQFVGLLHRSGLAARRPIEDHDRIEAMLRGADVLVTAWDGDQLVGVGRAISDFAYCTYLSDLAVDAAYQGRGVGKALVRLTHDAAGGRGKLILLAAPASAGYYPHIGMTRHASCWTLGGR